MKKQFLTAVAGTALIVSLSMSAFAAGWRQEAGTGRYWFEKDGASITETTSGWYKDAAGNWFAGTNPANKNNGYCSNGWWWILDAQTQTMKCYYFDAQGYMLANTTTPDNFQVNEKGEWVQNGVVQQIMPPAPAATLRADFDSTPYKPENYAGSEAIRRKKGGWQKDQNGWWYIKPDGIYCTNGWWWIFDNGIQGMKCYYFNEQGYMLANTTLEGSQLNANGEWVQNGVVQVKLAPSSRSAVTHTDMINGVSNAPAGGFTVSGGSSSSYDAQDDADEREREEARREEEREREEEERRQQEEEEKRRQEEEERRQQEEEEKRRQEEEQKAEDEKGMEPFKKNIEERFSPYYFCEIKELGNDHVEIILQPKKDDLDAIAETMLEGGYIGELVKEKWATGEKTKAKIAESVYFEYKDIYELNGNIIFIITSAKNKDTIYFKYENGKLIYDILKDENLQHETEKDDTNQQASREKFEEGIKKSFGNDYQIVKMDGEDIEINIWHPGNLDHVVDKVKQNRLEVQYLKDWKEVKDSLNQTSDSIYKESGFNGTLKVSIFSSLNRNRLFLTFENRRCLYDAIVHEGMTEEDKQEAYSLFTRKTEEFLSRTPFDYEIVKKENYDVTLTIYDAATPTYMIDSLAKGETIYISTWNREIEPQMRSFAKMVYDIYQSTELDGNVMVEIISGDKKTKLLSYENGQCVYDIA